MLNRKLSDLTVGELCGIVITAVVATFGIICLIMAASIMMSRPAYAAVTPQYNYQVDLKGPKDTMQVTNNICVVVGQASSLIQKMFNSDLSNNEIALKLTEAAMKDLSDRDGWAAYNMVGSVTVIDKMREWKRDDEFVKMRIDYPDYTMGEYYNVYARATCETAMGTDIKVIRVVRVRKGIQM
jgi:hypothetical protein